MRNPENKVKFDGVDQEFVNQIQEIDEEARKGKRYKVESDANYALEDPNFQDGITFTFQLISNALQVLEVNQDLSDEQKFQVVERLFKELHEPVHDNAISLLYEKDAFFLEKVVGRLIERTK